MARVTRPASQTPSSSPAPLFPGDCPLSGPDTTWGASFLLAIGADPGSMTAVGEHGWAAAMTALATTADASVAAILQA